MISLRVLQHRPDVGGKKGRARADVLQPDERAAQLWCVEERACRRPQRQPLQQHAQTRRQRLVAVARCAVARNHPGCDPEETRRAECLHRRLGDGPWRGEQRKERGGRRHRERRVATACGLDQLCESERQQLAASRASRLLLPSLELQRPHRRHSIAHQRTAAAASRPSRLAGLAQREAQQEQRRQNPRRRRSGPGRSSGHRRRGRRDGKGGGARLLTSLWPDTGR